jgi:hypothetical protein
MLYLLTLSIAVDISLSKILSFELQAILSSLLS